MDEVDSFLFSLTIAFKGWSKKRVITSVKIFGHFYHHIIFDPVLVLGVFFNNYSRDFDIKVAFSKKLHKS